MAFRHKLNSKVGWIWKAAAIIFFCIAAIELLFGFLLIGANHEITDYIIEGQRECQAYCLDRGDPLFLQDSISNICQCYNKDGKPTKLVGNSGEET